jgi:uncharacterized membrane protein YjjP (DUF1212 family)
VDEPSSPVDPPDPDDATEFVVRLGAALIAASAPVTVVHDRLGRLAAAYGLRLDTYVVPTGVWAVGWDERAIVSLSSAAPGTYRFDQTTALFDLVDRATAGAVPPDEGLAHLRSIEQARPRFGPWWSIPGVALVAAGIALVLGAGAGDLGVATALGALTGALRIVAVGRPSVETVLPALAAFVVGTIVLGLVELDLVEEPLRVLTPALVILLPGAMLTIGAIELAGGSLASGSGRIVAGFFTLLLLTFGLVVAGSVVGLSTADEVADPAAPLVGAWAPWLGVGIYVVGVGLTFSVPSGSWRLLFLVCFVAWSVQVLSYPLVGPYVSALVGAACGVLVACIADRHLAGPPPLVSFAPAFWLMVPGGVSLVGVTRATAGSGGGAQLSAALFTITAIALGVVIGIGADRSLRDRFGW